LRADGGKTPEPRQSAKPAPLTKARAKKADEGAAKGVEAKTEPMKAPPGQPHPVQEELEGHLQTLWKTGSISKSPGDPSSVNNPLHPRPAQSALSRHFLRRRPPWLRHRRPLRPGRIPSGRLRRQRGVGDPRRPEVTSSAI